MARAEPTGTSRVWSNCSTSHATVSALDPGKLPAIRQQIWTLMRAAKMDHDLGLEDRPDEDSFDDMLLHVDGWLCEIKDVQIRDGLHVLGQKPAGDGELDLVLAILRARQLFGGEQTVPGLRQALGLTEDRHRRPHGRRRRRGRGQGTGCRTAANRVGRRCCRHADRRRRGGPHPAVRRHRVVPRLAGTAGEIDQVLRALAGGFIASGPSGSPLRGLVNVLPTGRNFYSV
ncbi:cobaltochelatase subunit CobN, partial [Mycolicibacterium mageritense]|uniref:cobaltochelatase subunit CobN n=1 Tax=Mycolicibacterium mageritense TaxID=53462 RepID=UPI001E601ABE